MNIIQGRIQGIYTEGSSEFKKKILTVSINVNERCFVEVREEGLKDILKKMKKGDKIRVAISFEGKLGKVTKQRFNNIVAKTLEWL